MSFAFKKPLTNQPLLSRFEENHQTAVKAGFISESEVKIICQGKLRPTSNIELGAATKKDEKESKPEKQKKSYICNLIQFGIHKLYISNNDFEKLTCFFTHINFPTILEAKPLILKWENVKKLDVEHIYWLLEKWQDWGKEIAASKSATHMFSELPAHTLPHLTADKLKSIKSLGEKTSFHAAAETIIPRSLVSFVATALSPF